MVKNYLSSTTIDRRRAMANDLASLLAEPTLTGTWSMLVAPELVLRRIVETISVGEASVFRHVTFELNVPAKQQLLIPIMKPLRARLVDNLEVDPTPGSAASTLNRNETVIASVLLIRSIARTRIGDAQIDVDSPAALDVVDELCKLPVRTPKEGLVTIAAMRALSNEIEQQSDEETEESNEEIGAHLHTRQSEIMECFAAVSDDAQFVELMEFFRIYRPVLVPFESSDSHNVVGFSYEVPLAEVMTDRKTDRVRGALGHAPYDFRFEIPLAIRTPSYHLRFRAPTGQYVYKQEVLAPRFRMQSHWRPQSWELTQFKPAQAQSFVHGTGSRTGTFAHLYVGNIHVGNPAPRRLFAHIVVNERPLGELGTTLLRTSLSLGVLLAVAVLGGHFIAGSGGAGDVIAILVILPGLIGFLGGQSGGSDTILISPLLARVGGTLAAYCSLAGAIIVLWWASAGVKAGKLWLMPTAVLCVIAVVLGILAVLTVWIVVRIVVSWHRYRVARKAESEMTMASGSGN